MLIMERVKGMSWNFRLRVCKCMGVLDGKVERRRNEYGFLSYGNIREAFNSGA
jgi:hypothetical protein